MTGNLESLELFATLAETRSFRLTGERLGVSRSAVSQALRRLETRLGVLLVQRTTRSMRLTEAGERFLQAIAPALAEVSAAVRTVGDQQDQPAGLLRLAVSSIAEGFLSGPMLASFLAAHPLVRLDVVVSDAPLDIVAEGFDAGVRLEEAIEQDMVAVAASGAQRQLWSVRRIIWSGAERPHIRAISLAIPASGGVLGPTRPLTVGSSPTPGATSRWRSTPASPRTI